ncbi:hypothetical protein [Frankia sp. Mgl5]|uniref:hypothetical protein n=1 Tax=Frankia sp. Mgl5 TaxID=2933793 RepID=UPI0034D62124
MRGGGLRVGEVCGDVGGGRGWVGEAAAQQFLGAVGVPGPGEGEDGAAEGAGGLCDGDPGPAGGGFADQGGVGEGREQAVAGGVAPGPVAGVGRR